jgi:hypothetical protein
MTFHYTDADGERLEVEADAFEDGTPAVYIDTTAPMRIPLDHIEDLVAGVRDTRRTAATDSPPDPATEATDPDTCHLVDIAGQTLRVRGAGTMSEESKAALAEVVQAAARKFAEDQATIVQRVVDLRRAWCKAGPPPLGASMARWWDARLVELREALTVPPGYSSRTDDTAEEAKDRWAHQLVAVLADLDRCEHGRHEGDACGSCGGASLGNPHIGPDRVIGYSRLAAPIFLPGRDHKHEPAAWRTNPTTKDRT